MRFFWALKESPVSKSGENLPSRAPFLSPHSSPKSNMNDLPVFVL